MMRSVPNSKRFVLKLNDIWFLEAHRKNRPIAVPGSWNEQYQDLCYEEGPFTHKTTFYVPEELSKKHIRLYFAAVNTDCDVFLNGEKVGENHIGYLPFEVDVTGKVKPGENELRVVVENRLKVGGFPSKVPDSGTHTVGFFGSFPPANFDFFPYGGIIRPVLIEFTDHARILDIWVDTSESEPEKKLGKVKVKIEVSEEAVGQEMTIKLGEAEKRSEHPTDSSKRSSSSKTPGSGTSKIRIFILSRWNSKETSTLWTSESERSAGTRKSST